MKIYYKKIKLKRVIIMPLEFDILKEKIFSFWSDALNDILKIEENTALGRPDDLSLREIHVIEAAARTMKNDNPARAADIAQTLRIAPGTLTSAVDLLVKKGYLLRVRDETDRRGIRVALTESGIEARETHRAFHMELAGEIISAVGTEDARSLIRSLEAAHSFYLKKESSARAGSVKIFADSTCDLGIEGAEKLGVGLIPMNITFGDTVYRQDADLSASDFYRLLAESKTSPITSQLTPFNLEEIYRENTEDGGEIVAIHLSSALSGTYQSAVLAAREVPGVYVVDSKCATFGSALLVRTAVKLRESGMRAKEIADEIVSLSERLRLYAYIPTLKYLVRGGRLSVTAGVVGTMLNIYPIISVVDGAIKNVGKTRGKNAACAEIARLVNRDGIDRDYGVVFGHAEAINEVDKLRDSIGVSLDGCELNVCEIGAVIGVHTGPGAVGVAYIKPK